VNVSAERPHAYAAGDRRRPPALLVAGGAALAFVFALSAYVLLFQNHGGRARDSVPPDERPAPVRTATTTPPQKDEGHPTLVPREPGVAPAAAAPTPAAEDGGIGSDCEASSFRFREIVSPCFRRQELCNVGVKVRYDDRGQPLDVAFISEPPPDGAELAREARACVARLFAKLATPCSKATTVNYRQSCTPR